MQTNLRTSHFILRTSYFALPKGLTLVEVLVVVGILLVLSVLAVPLFRFFQKTSDINQGAEEVITTFKMAQSKTLASQGPNRWGVYFTTSTVPHSFTLFQGNSYLSRITSSDEVYQLANSVEFYNITLGGGEEAVFERVQGTTNQPGSVSLQVKSDPTKSKTIYLTSSGQTSFSSPATPSDAERVKDSRHTHFDYTRSIATASETLTLTFTKAAGGEVTEGILIATNMKEGQIYWEGEVDVEGSKQKIKLHTHRLNNPDTQFCVHRDRRYNDKALRLTISGDGSGTLIEYSANGEESRGTSISLVAGEAGDPQRQ